jgi:hypothetical protein
MEGREGRRGGTDGGMVLGMPPSKGRYEDQAPSLSLGSPLSVPVGATGVAGRGIS